MLTGDDLSTQYFIAGTAVAVLSVAVTQAGWTHRIFIRSMFVLGGTLVICAALWGIISQTFPRISAAANTVATKGLGWFTLLVVGFSTVLWLDYRARRSIKSQRDAPTAEALNNSLQGLLERVGRIEQLPPGATAEDHGKLVTTVVNLAKDTNARVDRLASNPQIDRDIMLVMHFVIYQSAILMLDSLLKAAPVDGLDSPLELGGSFALENESKKQFLDLVRRTLDAGADRRGRFEGVMRIAEHMAENEIKQVPMEQRPNGVDPLDLRNWAIIHRQCTRAVAFLQHERREVEEGLLAQRHNLLQRYSERNK